MGIRILGGQLCLDGDRPNGIRIKARNDDGWLRIEVEADEGVKGWALTYNGRDIPVGVVGVRDDT